MVSLTSVCKTATKIVILCLQVIMIMSQHFSKAEVLTSISHPQNGLNFLTVTPFNFNTVSSFRSKIQIAAVNLISVIYHQIP